MTLLINVDGPFRVTRQHDYIEDAEPFVGSLTRGGLHYRSVAPGYFLAVLSGLEGRPLHFFRPASCSVKPTFRSPDRLPAVARVSIATRRAQISAMRHTSIETRLLLVEAG